STSKSLTWSAGTGRSASLGLPGRSQPARKRDKETKRQGDKETRNWLVRPTTFVPPTFAWVHLIARLLVSPHCLPRSRPRGLVRARRVGYGPSPSEEPPLRRPRRIRTGRQ